MSLATLRLLDESISKKALRVYLSPLVPESSFNTGIKFLFEKHLVYGEGDRLLIAPDWETKLELWLETRSACNERQEVGDKRRAEEIKTNRIRVQKGKLTATELKQLLALPCVVEGCTNKRNHQQEHFPPRHFLKQLDVVTNRYFVWSICQRHNHNMADFIKTLDSTIDIFPNIFKIKLGVDPMRIYSASANIGIQKFYVAFQNDDRVAATNAIRKVLGLWKALELLDEADQSFIHEGPLCAARIKGKRAYSPHDSQLSVRQPLRRKLRGT